MGGGEIPGGSLASWPSPLGEPQVTAGPCFKKQGRWHLKVTWNWPLAFTLMQKHVHAYLYTHMKKGTSTKIKLNEKKIVALVREGVNGCVGRKVPTPSTLTGYRWCFWDMVLRWGPGWPWTWILLFQPPENQGSRCEPPHLAFTGCLYMTQPTQLLSEIAPLTLLWHCGNSYQSLGKLAFIPTCVYLDWMALFSGSIKSTTLPVAAASVLPIRITSQGSLWGQEVTRDSRLCYQQEKNLEWLCLKTTQNQVITWNYRRVTWLSSVLLRCCWDHIKKRSYLLRAE